LTRTFYLHPSLNGWHESYLAVEIKCMARRQQQFLIIFILGALSTISPFSIDMYLPGFPAIAKALGTTIDKVELSLTAYLAGIAIGQLFYGPLLDRYGRKTPLYVGLIIYVIASLVCATTSSVYGLIVMRFVQAIGGCAGIVAAQALVRDLFPVNKTAQAFSSLTLVIAVSPLIAPTIGGYVTWAFGWQSIFIILAIITALIILAVYFILPRGKRPDHTLSLHPSSVVKNFFLVLKQPQFLLYAVTNGIATAAPFAYIAGSSAVFMNQYHVSEQGYGWIFAIIAFAMIGTTQLNHVLLKKFNSETIIKFTLRYQTVVGLLLIMGTWLDWYNLYTLVFMMFIFFTGQGLTGPNATALSLAPFVRHTGSAAALTGCFRMAAGGIVSALVSIFHNNTAMPMVCVMVACVFVGIIYLSLGKKVVAYRASKKNVEEETSILI
jgi:DHA1 family bicyclomycin/chloramphenicol resistance-like MFS transporter